MYIITVKGKEVSRHEKEQDARSEFSRLRTKHGIDVKVRKESVSDIAKIKTQQHKLPSINRAKYGKRSGLEGPFMTKSGQVVYYDHKKGQYLDPDRDIYLSYDEWKKLSESRIMGLNKSSAEYKAGKEAAKTGIKYVANPHAPGVKRLNWST